MARLTRRCLVWLAMFPAWLVGAGICLLPGGTVAEAASPCLVVDGQVENPLALSWEELQAMASGGEVSLESLLAQARPKAEATQVVLVAPDGYAAPLAMPPEFFKGEPLALQPPQTATDCAQGLVFTGGELLGYKWVELRVHRVLVAGENY